jgi:hypothetical protein
VIEVEGEITVDMGRLKSAISGSGAWASPNMVRLLEVLFAMWESR